MTPQTRLGGFKVLKDVVRISLASESRSEEIPAPLFRKIADARINLPYVTAVKDRDSWTLNLLVEASNAARISRLLEAQFSLQCSNPTESAVLSIFPHKSDPTITGSLLEVFEQEGIDPDGYANSPSAISTVLKRGLVKKASNALFGPFSFSAYRTPADWKLAQRGKEQLYKEVVASYQEKRPKVYGLEYQQGQEFLHLRLKRGHVGRVGTTLKELARGGFYLTFIAKGPRQEEGEESLFLCLPTAEGYSHAEMIRSIGLDDEIRTISPVATFSMNGPHFGDRYGIVSELLQTLARSHVHLLAINCTIASIIGVVPSQHIEPAIRAIQDCFQVPTVTERET